VCSSDLQGFCLESYLDGLITEAFNALQVSFDLTHAQLPLQQADDIN
jgi:hypothetical protein